MKDMNEVEINIITYVWDEWSIYEDDNWWGRWMK